MRFRRFIALSAALVFFAGGCPLIPQKTIPPAPSPSPSPTPPSPVTNSACGESYGNCPRGFQCVQDCGPPVARDTDPSPGYHCLTDAEAAKPRMCPICLAADTRIATPDGEVSVAELIAGMKVWTVATDGSRVALPIAKLGKTPASTGQSIVHLTLEDGRDVSVSSGHPLVEGGAISDLKAGDPYDGSIVKSAESIAYDGEATYDLLPEGATGAYWANGILLRSTLGP